MTEDKPTKNAAAVELGHLGGLKGGKARAKKLTPERRSEIARNANKARWSKILEKRPKVVIKDTKTQWATILKRRGENTI